MQRSRSSRLPAALAVALLAGCSALPVFADVTVTASVGTGVMFGTARELVYSTAAYNGSSFLESELDWQIQPLILTRAALALSTPVGFFASLVVRLGVPAKTGVMEDSDWLNYTINGNTTKTNYSRSDCYTERAILLDAQAGWDLPLASWASIEPFLALGFMDFKWTARDGYYQYDSIHAQGSYQDYTLDSPTPVSGTGVIYQQTYVIPSAGLAVKLRFGAAIGCSFSFTFSPQVLCNDVDNHLLRSLDFYDTMTQGFLLEPRVSMEWQVSARARLTLDVSYRHIADLRGSITTVQTGAGVTPSPYTTDGAGASFDALDASVNLVWSL